MSDEATSKSGKTWLYVVGTIVSLLLLYAASIGPVTVLFFRGVVPKFVESAYTPLIKFAEFTGTTQLLHTYQKTWLELTGTPLRFFP